MIVDQDIEAAALRSELAEKIMRLLSQEPSRTKDIVLMRIQGYSFFEIAAKHRISESSARVLNHRAKKRIRTALMQEGVNDE